MKSWDARLMDDDARRQWLDEQCRKEVDALPVRTCQCGRRYHGHSAVCYRCEDEAAEGQAACHDCGLFHSPSGRLKAVADLLDQGLPPVDIRKRLSCIYPPGRRNAAAKRFYRDVQRARKKAA